MRSIEVLMSSIEVLMSSTLNQFFYIKNFFFHLTSFHTFFMVFLIPHPFMAHPLSFQLLFIHPGSCCII